MTTTLLDPTGELDPVERQPLSKPASLDGLTLGLLDISKARGNIFLDRLDTLFTERGITVKRYKKPTFTRPAPVALIQQMATEVDVVVEGLAD
jgi:hypothetical protein